MKIKKLISTLCFLVFVQFTYAQKELSIATFNCEFLNLNKVHIKYGLPFSVSKASSDEQKFWKNDKNRAAKFKEASRAVAKQIKAIDADIIGLTEVGDIEDIKVLLNELNDLGLKYNFHILGESKDYYTGQHVALLSKYELKEIQTQFSDRGLYFTESDNDESNETGISKGLKATVNFNGEEIHLFLLHFISEGGGEEKDRQRVKQAELIRAMTIPYLQKGKHIVIMGDFNSEKRHPVLLTIRGFNDIYEELIQTGDSYYFKEEKALRWTYDYLGEKEQIDHILLSIPLSDKCYSNSKTRFGIETEIIPTTQKLVSDHNALKVKLTFKD